jgi:hypothetical protein
MKKRIIVGGVLGALIMPAYAAAYYFFGPNGIQLLTVTLGFTACGVALAMII